MDAQSEHRNKKGDKVKRNKRFPYKRIGIREDEKRNQQNTTEQRED